MTSNCTGGGADAAGGRTKKWRRRTDQLAEEIDATTAQQEVTTGSGRRGEEAWLDRRERPWRQDARKWRQQASCATGAPRGTGLLDGGEACRGRELGRHLLRPACCLLLQLEREVRRRRREHRCVLADAEERHLTDVMRDDDGGGGGRRRRVGAARARPGEALHDGHELAGIGVHDLGRHRVDDDRLPHLLHGLLRRLPDLVGVRADPERRRARALQLPGAAAALRGRRRGGRGRAGGGIILLHQLQVAVS